MNMYIILHGRYRDAVKTKDIMHVSLSPLDTGVYRVVIYFTGTNKLQLKFSSEEEATQCFQKLMEACEIHVVTSDYHA